MNHVLNWVKVALVAATFTATIANAAEHPAELRLYALDCGHITHKDMSAYSDTGEYDGKSGILADPCFLIANPKGWLLWDTGLGDALVGAPKDLPMFGGTHLEVARSLTSQLQQLGLTPGDITFVAFSHFHLDHVGNANAFTASTWLLRKAELNHGLTAPPPPGIVPELFSGYQKAKVVFIEGDHDVFGDGKVKILATPGHTPGHQVLWVKLAQSGPIILSGDLYHLQQSREHGRVPVMNSSRADTLASMQRVETLRKNTGARIVVQHDPDAFKSLPAFPAYLK